MQLHAQYSTPQNDFWAFGTSNGVNFLPGIVPHSSATTIGTYEGSASICNNSGQLLFYTAGLNNNAITRVYDRLGNVMPHGANIVPYNTYSTTQAAEIIPVIGNPNQYYIFSLESRSPQDRSRSGPMKIPSVV